MNTADGGNLLGRRTAAVGLALILTVAAADAVLDPGEGLVLTPMLVVGPLVAAVRASPRQVAGLALLASVLSVPLAAIDDDLLEPGHIGGVIGVTVVGALAIGVARMRERLEESAASSGRQLADERVARRRAELLARAVELLEAPLDEHERLDAVAGLPVPDMADLVTIDLLDDAGRFRSTIARGTDADVVADLLEMRRRYPLDSTSSHPLATVARSATPLVLDEIPEHLLAEVAEDDEHLRLLRALRYRSTVILPLILRGRTIGVLAMLRIGKGKPFDDQDVQIARELTRRVAPAVENARLVGDLRAAEARLETIIANLQEGVAAFAPDGTLLFANDASEALLGPEGDLAAGRLVLDEGGVPVPPERLPLVAALAGRTPPPATFHAIDAATGRDRWLVARAVPVLGADGTPELIVQLVEDVTAVKREEVRQRFLAEATKLVASSLDVAATVDQAAWAAVPALADWARVDIVGEDGQLREAAVAHRDPGRVELLREWRRDVPPDPQDGRGPWEVLRTGRPLVWEVASDDEIRDARSERHAELLRAIGTRSVLIVPLRLGDRVLGTLELATTRESERRLGPGDAELAREFGERAAIAVEHARMHEGRTQVAATLQESLLPPELPSVPGLRFASRFRAASEAAEVGGDFYDVFQAADEWFAVIGDVTGKGPAAAATTSMARYAARTAALYEPDPEQILTRMDDVLAAEGSSRRLCTAICVRLQPQSDGVRATVVCAGHPPPYLVRRDGGVEEAGRTGPLLGAFADCDRAPHDLLLTPGDVLVMFTDGVTDARGAEDRFGHERLEAVLRATGSRDPETVAEAIDSAVRAFEVGPQRDDVAVLVVGATGADSLPNAGSVRR